MDFIRKIQAAGTVVALYCSAKWRIHAHINLVRWLILTQPLAVSYVCGCVNVASMIWYLTGSVVVNFGFNWKLVTILLLLAAYAWDSIWLMTSIFESSCARGVIRRKNYPSKGALPGYIRQYFSKGTELFSWNVSVDQHSKLLLYFPFRRYWILVKITFFYKHV
jgi:hypothetical protein